MSRMAEALFGIISGSYEHLSADEVYLLCKQQGVKCSIASIYRNLSALVADGKIRKLSIPGEADKYDKNIMPHEHLICEKCHCVCDVNLDGLKQFLEERTGAKIDRYILSMHYICPKCRKNG